MALWSRGGGHDGDGRQKRGRNSAMAAQEAARGVGWAETVCNHHYALFLLSQNDKTGIAAADHAGERTEKSPGAPDGGGGTFKIAGSNPRAVPVPAPLLPRLLHFLIWAFSLASLFAQNFLGQWFLRMNKKEEAIF